MHSLQDKVCLVTGGANGIGGEITKALAREGAKAVLILDIDAAGAEEVKRQLSSEYAQRVQFRQCDVSDEQQLTSALQELHEQLGPVNVIVNNAGIADESLERHRKQIELNFGGVVTSTLRGLDMMRTDKGGQGGTIINISSMLGLMRLSPGSFVYNAIKSSLIHFGGSIGMEPFYKRTNVRVLTVCFGFTQTNIFNCWKSFDEDITKHVNEFLGKLVEAGRTQTPEEAANGVVECFKNGESGSTWLVDKGASIDISSSITAAYDVFNNIVTSNN